MKRSALGKRETLMLAGLFLSKFDRDALAQLGFATFREAFNTLGFALGGNPNSIKNYRQEFDPAFPNGRAGWHGREMRSHCRTLLERFGGMSAEALLSILRPLIAMPGLPAIPALDGFGDFEFGEDAYSKRMMTGAAAEGFFETNYSKHPEFVSTALANVTRFGCGFDFQMTPLEGAAPFTAVEVKGLSGKAGEISMTDKEIRAAERLRNRYYLCVVRNFIEFPEMTLYRDPLSGGLEFQKRERVEKVVAWSARL